MPNLVVFTENSEGSGSTRDSEAALPISLGGTGSTNATAAKAALGLAAVATSGSYSDLSGTPNVVIKGANTLTSSLSLTANLTTGTPPASSVLSVINTGVNVGAGEPVGITATVGSGGRAIVGNSDNFAVHGAATSSGTGVLGTSNTGEAIRGTSTSGYGVRAFSGSGVAARFETFSASENIAEFYSSNTLRAHVSNNGTFNAAALSVTGETSLGGNVTFGGSANTAWSARQALAGDVADARYGAMSVKRWATNVARSSSGSLAVDATASVNIPTGETWLAEARIKVTAHVDGGFRARWVIGSGTNVSGTHSLGQSDQSAAGEESSADSTLTLLGPETMNYTASFFVRNDSGSTRSLQFWWSQSVSEVSPTTVLANSVVLYRRIE